MMSAAMGPVWSKPKPPIIITFEGITDSSEVADYYNGTGPINYGISFQSNAIALVNNPGITNFPAPGDTVMAWVSGGDTTITMSSGWTGTFTFTYSGASDLTVTIRDILGNILVTSPDLPGIGGVGCSGFYLCQWNTYSLSFSGVAASVNFSGLAAEIAVDNLTFGS